MLWALRGRPLHRRLGARALRLFLGILVLPGLERRRVGELLLLHVHHQLHAAVAVVADLQAIQLQRYTLLADAEKAADADDEAVDGLGVLAENEIADGAD